MLFLLLIIFIGILVALFIFALFQKTRGFSTNPKTFGLPFSYKEYLARNATIKIQHKLFYCSKQFSRIIHGCRRRRCDSVYISHFDDIYKYFQDRHVLVKISHNHKYLIAEKPLLITEYLEFSNELKNQKVREVRPKLDLSQLKSLNLSRLNLSEETFRMFLLPSLMEINFLNTKVTGVDIPLAVFQECPLATKIWLTWQSNSTSLENLAAINRRKKIKELQIYGITDTIKKYDLKNFLNEHVVIGSNGKIQGKMEENSKLEIVHQIEIFFMNNENGLESVDIEALEGFGFLNIKLFYDE